MNIEQFIDQMPEEQMMQIAQRAELIALKSAVRLMNSSVEQAAKELRQDAFNMLMEKAYEKHVDSRSFGFALPEVK